MTQNSRILVEASDTQLICAKNKLHRETLCDYILTPAFTEFKHLIASRLMQEKLEGNHYLQLTVTATIGDSKVDLICEDRIF
jgi:hypothetical protein